MAQSETGLIHTKASYAPDLEIGILNSSNIEVFLYDSAYQYLKEQEKAFYDSVFPGEGIQDIDTFLAKIRKLLEDAQKDIQCLKNFTNASLVKYLPKKKPNLFEQNAKLIFYGDIKQININIRNDFCIIEGGFSISITPDNVQSIKGALNDVLKRDEKDIRRFHQESNKITRNLTKILSKSIEKNFKYKNLFRVQIDENATSPMIKEFDIREVSKQKYNMDNVGEILNDPNRKKEASQLRMEARKSIAKMKDFLFSKASGCSIEMKEAMNETWKEIFPPDGEDILLKRFFFEGENYSKALLGQVGEFANDVFIRYLAKKTRNSSSILTKIIGSMREGGQQPHSDLQIMLACGAKINFQTKNVNAERNIKVNTDAGLISKNFGENMISPLVNYYTNTSYQAVHGNIIEEIELVLQNLFFRSMNLNIKAGLDELQTNTFYYVGGNNIIPGSEIIRHLRTTEKPQFHISGGGVSSNSDEGYASGKPPVFITGGYWKYPKGKNRGEMVPGKDNASKFSKAASSISISTSFNISNLINSGRFELFKAY